MYSSLHNHTEYSNLRLLDCTNKIEVLIQAAIDLGLHSIAITDHESLSGWVKAVKKQEELEKTGSSFRIFLGDEIYLVDSLEEVRDNYQSGVTKFFHGLMIAKDKIGALQIQELSSLAWDNSFYTGKMERVPTVKKDVERIIGENKGHIIFSTACVGGELAHWIIKDDPTRCLEFIDWCQDIFLEENFFLEMQPNDDPVQTKVNKAIVKISEQINIPYIITTDTHYLSADQASVHEAYLKSRDSDEREVGEFYKTCYLMSEEEIHGWMDEQIGADCVNKALENTLKIADMIQPISLKHSQVVPKPHLPEFELAHLFKDYYQSFEYLNNFAHSSVLEDRYFLYLIEQGWLKKELSDISSEGDIILRLERLELEFKAIWESSIKIQDNVASYYVTALEIENMMWDDGEDGGNSLVGVSRGSVAAFYSAYLIGLQQINPIKYNIPYWRHLHESRPEMPDVDIDTEASKRERIIEATRKKFGRDKVLNICTFKTEGPKSAIATVARAMGVDNDAAQYIKNLIPTVRGKTTPLSVMVNGDVEAGEKPNKEFIAECEKYPGLLDTAMTIEGLISGRSIHASGVIIFESPYTELNCMMRAPNKQPTTQWDMDDSTYCGGLKFDYLTIVNLDAMHKCLDFLVEYGYIEWQGSLKSTYDKYFHPDVIDYASQEMWKMAENLEILNLFQFMTTVGQQAIKKIKPKSLLELGVANAVMRLMASGKDAEQPLDIYVKYKNDIQRWYDVMGKYHLTPDEIVIIEKYLKDVYGMATMQEDVMRLVMDPHIGNFDMVGANKIRKSIAKKKAKLQLEAKDMFYKKGKQARTSDNLLNYVWNECIVPQLGLNNNEGSSKTWETQAKAVSKYLG